jgi:hypothetical protein
MFLWEMSCEDRRLMELDEDSVQWRATALVVFLVHLSES